MHNANLIYKEWLHGDAVAAGEMIFSRIDQDTVVLWATRIFHYSLEISKVSNDLTDSLVRLSNNPLLYSNAKLQFRSFRDRFFVLSDLLTQVECDSIRHNIEIELSVCIIGEIVTKILYNQSLPSDPFDQDAGGWLPAALKDLIVEVHGDQNIYEQAWNLICFKS